MSVTAARRGSGGGGQVTRASSVCVCMCAPKKSHEHWDNSGNGVKRVVMFPLECVHY